MPSSTIAHSSTSGWRRSQSSISSWRFVRSTGVAQSPKIYVADSGLACHLLGIDTDTELRKSPFRGSLYEGLVAAEICKRQFAAGRRREVYYFRDQQGLEVDFVVPGRNGSLRLVEVKATATPCPGMATPILDPAPRP